MSTATIVRFLGAFSFVVLVILVATVAARPAADAGRERGGWEYRAFARVEIEKLIASESRALDGANVQGLTEGLNKLGTDGWELVAIEPPHSSSESTYAPAKVDGKEDSSVGLRGIRISYPATYIFKRRR